MPPAVPATGVAWAALEQLIDPLVDALVDANGLPGITVAITRNGKLLLSKGYGYARMDGAKKRKMGEGSRLKIGSTCKPSVTGTCAFEVMSRSNLNPTTTHLYGPDGLFDGRYDDDILQGTRDLSSTEQRAWYAQITVQHLFDHHAGFAESADISGAAKHFDIPDDDVTYEHLHRHFLLTKRLLHPPGTYDYSNFGFGLFTLIIEKLSGKPFPEYVRDDYLAPLGLESRIRPEREHADSCDAWRHDRKADGSWSISAFSDSGPGLAQGGFMASAEDLARIMASLAEKYTDAEIDSMGWARTDRGMLHHSGRLSGGTSYIAMYPEGYTSKSGVDIGGTSIAIATNVSTSTDDLTSLAGPLALAVPESGAPATLNLWTGRQKTACEYVRTQVDATSYQRICDDAMASGYTLEWIDGYWDGSTVRFNVIFRVRSSPRGPTHHNMTKSDYQEKYDKYKASGRSLVHVDSYLSGSSVRYAAIWAHGETRVRAYHDRTRAQHQETLDSWTSEGWRPKVVSVVSVDGERRYTAMYTQESIGQYQVDSSMTSDEYQGKYDDNKAARRHIVYLNSYMHRGEPMFTAIWAEEPEVSHTRAGHKLSASGFAQARQDALDAGLRTRAITGCGQTGDRLAAYWNG